MLHSLSHQGITKEAYLRISGRTEEEILAEAKPDAEQALRREAVLAAVVEAEQIEPSDGDLLDALQATAARESTSPEKLLRAPREGRAARRAARRPRPARRARPDRRARERRSSVEQAKARDKLWTPGQGAGERGPALDAGMPERDRARSRRPSSRLAGLTRVGRCEAGC